MPTDTWTLLVVVTGPTTAAILSFCASIWYQNRKQKREAQEYIFRTLMIHRGVGFPPYELVNALNLIDVIFSKTPKIVGLWHQYLDLISRRAEEVDWPLARFAYQDLLSGIGNLLGYGSLSSTDFARFYHPTGHIQLSDLNAETQQELLRVLKGTAHFEVAPKSDEPSSSSSLPSPN